MIEKNQNNDVTKNREKVLNFALSKKGYVQTFVSEDGNITTYEKVINPDLLLIDPNGDMDKTGIVILTVHATMDSLFKTTTEILYNGDESIHVGGNHVQTIGEVLDGINTAEFMILSGKSESELPTGKAKYRKIDKINRELILSTIKFEKDQNN